MSRTSQGSQPVAPGSAAALLIVVLAAGCGGGGSGTPQPTPALTAVPAATGPATAAPRTIAPTGVPTTAATGPATLQAPASIEAGTAFEVGWTGPNGPGDYVTIVPKGATAWTNEPYFDTATGNPGRLQASIEAGAYEIWYVLGSDSSVHARIDVTVTPYSASVTGPAEVARGATFDVQWTGPDGPGDYVTVAPVLSPEGTYLSYCDTSTGSTCRLTAPDQSGAYELRYVTAAGKTLASEPIAVT